MAQDFSNATFHPQWQQLLAPAQPAQQAAPQQKKGRGGFLSSIISELGGGGGAAGGAALGTLLLPGIGTVIGGGLGGLLGGFGGKAVEQKVRDNQNLFGAGGSFKKDLGEGALDAGLSAGGELFSAAKGAKAAGIGLRQALTPEGAQLAEDATKGGAGLLTKSAQNIKSAGVGALDTKSGIGAFGDEAARLATANDYKIPSGLKGLQKSETLVNGLESKITPLLKDTKIPVSTVNDAIDKIAQSTLSPVAESPQFITNLKSLVVRQAGEDGTIGGDTLRDIRSQLGTVFKKNGTTPLAGLQRDAYHGLGEVIGEAAPKARELIGEQGRLFDLASGLKGRAEGANLPFISKFAGKSRIAGQARDFAGDKAAGILGTAGAVADTGLAKNLLRQSPAGLSRALGGMNTQPDQSTDVSPQIPDPSQNVDPSIGAPMQAQQPTYSLQNALMDAQRDPKNASQYLAFANAFSAQAKNSASDTKLTAAQSTLKDGITSALAALDSTEQLLSTAGGAKGATGATANIPILGQYLNPSGHSYEATKTDTALQLAKALSGTSRAPASVFQQVLHSLPSVTDTPQVAANKIANLRAQVQAQAHAHGFDDILGDNSSGSQAQLAQILAGLGQ